MKINAIGFVAIPVFAECGNDFLLDTANSPASDRVSNRAISSRET
jgi:hypothetical protein